MTYEALVSIIEKTGRVKMRDLMEVIEFLFQYAHIEDDCADYLSKKDDLLDLICTKKLFEGGVDDFHNLSVAFAKEEDFFNACRILDKGLERFSYSIDLLADYLNYGMKCDRVSECGDAYKKLSSIKERWNWRAYQFSIDYLKECQKSDPSLGADAIRELIDEFVAKMPDKEECYLEKAEFLRDIDSCDFKDTFVSVLEYATSDDCPIQRTPKCDLTLADYLYDNGKDLTRAMKLIERCKRNSVEPQLSVNRNYVYLLSALCKMSLFYDSLDEGAEKKVSEETEEGRQVLSVFDDYHVAATGKPDSRVRKCKEIIEAFVRETGIAYPYDDGVENSL